MSEPKFVQELPRPVRSRIPVPARDSDVGSIVRTVVALAQQPGEWAEVRRHRTKAAAYAQRHRWRGYGLDAEVRADGGTYALYARVPLIQSA